MADRVIDTSQFTTNGLRNFVIRSYGQDEKRMKINLVSFGYAYGIPAWRPISCWTCGSSRTLSFVEGMREKTGLAPDVAAYVKIE